MPSDDHGLHLSYRVKAQMIQIFQIQLYTGVESWEKHEIGQY